MIGEQLGIDWSKFDVEQFQNGNGVWTLEHGTHDLQTNVTQDDSLTTGKNSSRTSMSFRTTTRLKKMES